MDDVKDGGRKLTEHIFEERGIGFIKPIIPSLKKLMEEKIQENLSNLPLKPDYEKTYLIHCRDCQTYYVQRFGHLCLCRREQAGNLEILEIVQDGDPFYL